jgi:exopolyphosphatase/guanosine-5'-triphosphate,3'-diphosphate pyrophosphatase
VQEKPLSYIYVNSQYAFFELAVIRTKNIWIGFESDRKDVIIPRSRNLLECDEVEEQGKFMYQKIGLMVSLKQCTLGILIYF